MPMTPRERAINVSALIAKIKAHPMCLRFEQESGIFRVIYPEGFQLDGAQARYSTNKSESLERLLSVIERHWLESYPK